MVINILDFVQLKAFARQYGLALAALWTASFLATMLSPASPLGSLLALATPFVVGWLLVRFRDRALDGRVSFRRGFAFSCYTFFYAAFIFAAVQYVYFRFFDHGTLMGILDQGVAMMEQVYHSQGAAGAKAAEQLRQTATLVGQLSPMEITFVIMMDNLLAGFVMSFPIAFICKRSTAETTFNNPENKES